MKEKGGKRKKNRKLKVKEKITMTALMHLKSFLK
jgi:hypothetical protein